MITPDLFPALLPVVEAFDTLGIPYHIGGSVASSVHGAPRATLDIDLVADIQLAQVAELVRHLHDTYYIDAEMIRDAIRRRASFTILHLETIIKVDVFLPKARPVDHQVQQRVVAHFITTNEGRGLNLASAEDSLLVKLEWYRMGGGVSDRQWKDSIGIIKRKADTLDLSYLRTWATALAVTDLLDRALAEVGQS